MAQPLGFLRRAMLYVPGASSKMLLRSRAVNVDTVIYDLEDSVTPEAKSMARTLVAQYLADTPLSHRGQNRKELSVRINAIDTGLALDDISELMKVAASHLDTIVVPKVQSEADLHFVADVVRHIAPDRAFNTDSASEHPKNRPVNIIALIESARGLSNIHSICRSGHFLGLSGIAFAAEDFTADLSLSRLPDKRELLFARSSMVTAARAHDIPSVIDLVTTGIPTTEEGKAELESDSLEGRALGFTGKQCIHPLQVDIAQRAFGPSDKEVEWAVCVDVGDGKARVEGKGAWMLAGKMVDVPVVKRARAVLYRAELCGINVQGLRERLRRTSSS